MKKITVALPTRNRYQALLVCLESLRKQTFKDFIVLLSDNGSSDETDNFDPTLFPDLEIKVVHRNPALPGAGEHYQVLFSEIETPWMALAHDDEIYHPEWLETLIVSCTPDTAISFGKILLRDIRRGYPTYHHYRNELPAGRYSGNEMKRKALTYGEYFPGQALVLRTDIIQSAMKEMMNYEQYDLAFLMKCCEQGETVVSDKILATYTLHRSNTLGSGEYVDESSRRIHPCLMLGEWLDDVAEGLPIDTVESIRARLKLEQVGGEMTVLMKNWTSISPQVWKRLTERILNNPLCTTKYRLIIHILEVARMFPRPLSIKAMTFLLKLRGVRKQPFEISITDAEAIFPYSVEDHTWRSLVR